MAIGATVIKEATMAATSTMRWYSERAIISQIDVQPRQFLRQGDLR